MASVHSAGIVLYRLTGGGRASGAAVEETYEILLVHPGGPFWANKDDHGWSIPKGEFDPETEAAPAAARREFEEELGRPVPDSRTAGEPIELPSFRAGRKHIHATLIGADFDPTVIHSNSVEIEWPPRSGRSLVVPEVDRASWVSLQNARNKLHKGQVPLVDLVVAALSDRADDGPPATNDDPDLPR